MTSLEEIWQLGLHFGGGSGGADRYFETLVRELEKGDTPLISGAFGGEDVLGKTHTRLSLGSADSSLIARRAMVREFGAKLLVSPARKVCATHFALYSFFLLPFLRTTPHVVHFHGPWSLESGAEGAKPWSVFVKRCLETRVYRSAARCIVLSNAFSEILHSNFGVAEKAIRTVPGCADTEHFTPGDGRAAARARLGWSPEKTILFSVRRLVRRVGVAELIEAFARIAGKHPNCDLHIAGRGPLEQEFRSLALRAGVGERVRFLGFVDDDTLAECYRAADVTVVPSQDLEGFGLVVPESLSCGTPVAVTPVGGLPEAAAGCGVVAAGREPEAISAMLEKVVAGSVSLPNAATCRRVAERDFAPAVMASRVRAIYEEVAA